MTNMSSRRANSKVKRVAEFQGRNGALSVLERGIHVIKEHIKATIKRSNRSRRSTRIPTLD